MPQSDHISTLPVPEPGRFDSDIQAVYQRCMEKLDLVPNVLRAYSLHPTSWRFSIYRTGWPSRST